MILTDIVYENKSTPFSVMRATTLSPSPHLHKEIEIVYVAEGTAEAHADRNRCQLATGDLFISFPNQIHFYNNATIGTYYVIIITAELFFGLKNLLNGNIPEENSLRIRPDDAARRYLEQIMNAAGDYCLTERTGYANLLMSRLLPQLKLRQLVQTDHSTLRAILEYCSQHFAEEITLDMLANNLHLSKYHISHLFNSKLGLSFSDYINTLRINLACRLLRESEQKIADISEETGFGTIRSFNRTFLRIMQMTPQQYRERTRPSDGRHGPSEIPTPQTPGESVCC